VFEAQNICLFKQRQMDDFSGIYCSGQATTSRALKTEAFMVVYNFMDQGGCYGKGVLHV